MTTRDAKGGDQITDADALLPNGCELTNYHEGGITNNRTNFAVIIRNGSQGTTSSRPVATEPLLPIDKNAQNLAPEKCDPKLYLQDPISYAVGQFGRWQLQLTMLLALFNFPCTWHIFVLTFQGDQGSEYWCSKPEHLKDMSLFEWRNISSITDLKQKFRYNPCAIKDLDYSSVNSTVNHKEVEAIKKCDSWEFVAHGDSIVSEWALVCDNAQLSNMAEMMFLLGVALGGFFSGLVSDRFGRKKTLMMSLLLQIIVGVLVAICPWFEVFLILRAILGFVCVSIVFSGLILCMELVGGKWLTIAGVSYMFPVPLSYIILAGMAYTARGWRHLQLTITLPSILFLSFWWILPESPRWLLTTGQIDKVMEILKEAARVNRRILPPNIDKVLKQSISVVDVTDKPKGRISDLFRTPTIRLISIVLYIIWFSVYLVYYGLVLNLSNIGGDVYVNTIISGIVEVPAIGLSILVLLKMGRRVPLCLTLVCAGTACFLTLVVPERIHFNGLMLDERTSEWLTITFVMVGKFTVSASNVIMPVYTAELFPTVIRNLGVGSSNVPAGIALMIVPYLWNMAKWHHHLPMMILGITGVVGGFSVLLLPETSNQGLAATLEDIEEETTVKKQKEIDSTK